MAADGLDIGLPHVQGDRLDAGELLSRQAAVASKAGLVTTSRGLDGRPVDVADQREAPVTLAIAFVGAEVRRHTRRSARWPRDGPSTMCQGRRADPQDPVAPRMLVSWSTSIASFKRAVNRARTRPRQADLPDPAGRIDWGGCARK